MLIQKGRICVAALGMLLFAATLSGQETTASLRGALSTPAARACRRPKSRPFRQETGFTRSGVSDAEGDYLLVLLPIGHYRLEVTAQGFRKYVQEGISLSVNQVAQVPVHLEVGLPQQTVQVKADAALLATTNDLGETVHDSEIVDLPLNGRNFSQLGLLLPGTAPLTQGLQLAGGSMRGGQSYAVNGMRPESNEFLVDGAENYNSINAGFVLKPPPDAIAEFRILTNTASAEFGHNAGSSTNIVTRSGSNQIHGDVYDFLRNDAVDARNFFSTSVDPLKQNQFGGTLGGPIRRDKTFLFGFYEGFRNRQGETQLTTVPTAAERQGNFRRRVLQLFAPGILHRPHRNAVGERVRFAAATAALQPASPGRDQSRFRRICWRSTRCPMSPTTVQMRIGATQELQNTSDQFGLRLDHYISSRDTISFHYLFTNGSQLDPLSIAGANVPGFPVGEDFRAQNAALEETHSFSPRVVNVAPVFLPAEQVPFWRGDEPYARLLAGIPVLPHAGKPSGAALSSKSGAMLRSAIPSPGRRTIIRIPFRLTDSLAWVHGRHELKFGGEFQRDQLNTLLGIASNGFFVFAPVPIIGDAFADFLIGQPVVFLQGGGQLPAGHARQQFQPLRAGQLQGHFAPDA